VRHLYLGLLVCVGIWPLVARADVSPARTKVFVHVNVVPMDRERVLADQTVIVAGDKIVAIGSQLPVPPGAHVIDGHKTAYLSPGLADMHTHSETLDDLAVYLTTGVTTVLHMGGADAGFVDNIVPAVNRGAIPGPHVYTSFRVDGSTDYNGFVIKTPAQARAIVGLAKTNNYDFMKVYVGLSPDVFSALAAEGRRLALPLIGHGVYAVRLERQLAEGQALIAHAEEFFYTLFYAAWDARERCATGPEPYRISSHTGQEIQHCGNRRPCDLCSHRAANWAARSDHLVSRPTYLLLSIARRSPGLAKKRVRQQDREFGSKARLLETARQSHG
jgi:hypothetical protein